MSCTHHKINVINYTMVCRHAEKAKMLEFVKPLYKLMRFTLTLLSNFHYILQANSHLQIYGIFNSEENGIRCHAHVGYSHAHVGYSHAQDQLEQKAISFMRFWKYLGALDMLKGILMEQKWGHKCSEVENFSYWGICPNLENKVFAFVFPETWATIMKQPSDLICLKCGVSFIVVL